MPSNRKLHIYCPPENKPPLLYCVLYVGFLSRAGGGTKAFLMLPSSITTDWVDTGSKEKGKSGCELCWDSNRSCGESVSGMYLCSVRGMRFCSDCFKNLSFVAKTTLFGFTQVANWMLGLACSSPSSSSSSPSSKSFSSTGARTGLRSLPAGVWSQLSNTLIFQPR